MKAKTVLLLLTLIGALQGAPPGWYPLGELGGEANMVHSILKVPVVGYLYAGVSDRNYGHAARIYKSTDGGYTWSCILGVGGSYSFWDIQFDQQNYRLWGVTNVSGKPLYYSLDYGEHWHYVEAPEPVDSVGYGFSIFIHNGKIYVGGYKTNAQRLKLYRLDTNSPDTSAWTWELVAVFDSIWNIGKFLKVGDTLFIFAGKTSGDSVRVFKLNLNTDELNLSGAFYGKKVNDAVYYDGYIYVATESSAEALVYKSADGENWQLIFSLGTGSNPRPWALQFFYDTLFVGIEGGNQGRIYKSSDMGNTWTQCFTPATAYNGGVFEITIIDGELWIGTGYSGDIFKANWLVDTNSTYIYGPTWIYDVKSHGDRIYIATNYDQGEIWSFDPANRTASIWRSFPDASRTYAIFFVDDTVFVSIDDARIKMSADGGTIWRDVFRPGGASYVLIFDTLSTGEVVVGTGNSGDIFIANYSTFDTNSIQITGPTQIYDIATWNDSVFIATNYDPTEIYTLTPDNHILPWRGFPDGNKVRSLTRWRDTIFVVINDNRIKKSSDGSIWKEIFSPQMTSYVLDMDSLRDGTLLALTGNAGDIFKVNYVIDTGGIYMPGPTWIYDAEYHGDQIFAATNYSNGEIFTFREGDRFASVWVNFPDASTAYSMFFWGDTVLVGVNDGRMKKSYNGHNWTDIFRPGGASYVLDIDTLKNGDVIITTGNAGDVFKMNYTVDTSRITIDGPTFVYDAVFDQNEIYIATNYSNGEIWRSEDNSATWENITGTTQPWSKAYSLVVIGDTIIAGTDYQGDVFISYDGGDNWTPTGDLSGASYVLDLLLSKFVYPYRVLAGTGNHGDIFLSDSTLMTPPPPPRPDLTPTNLVVEHQDDGLLITATVANHGDTARNIPIRFMVEDLTAGTGELLTIADSVIDELDPGQSTTVSTFWTPRFSSYTLYVSVDPDNIIPETNEENNIISETFRERGPIVQAVVAEYDGDPDEDIFGRYISGVELINRFTAQVTDPDSAEDVARVMFIFGSDTLVDDDPSDGWSVEYDVGRLPHVAPLKVIAYDLSGTPSEPVTYTVNTAPMPHWLQVYMQDFGCDFYFDYDAGVYRTGEQYFPVDVQGDYFIPPDVLLLGNLETRVAGGAVLNASVPLERGGDPIPFNPDFGGDVVILGNEIFHGDLYEMLEELGREHYVVVTGYLDPWSLEFNQIEFHMNQPFEFDPFVLPEAHRDLHFGIPTPVGVPIPVTVGVDLGGEVTPRIDDVGAFINSSFAFDSLFIDPTAEIIVDLSAKIGIAFDVASVAFIAHPTADLESRLLYPPPGFHLSGAFLVPFELVGSLGWGFVSGTLYQDTLGPWTFGTEGERILAERMPLLLARLDSLNLPDILPNPYMATDPYGHAMVVWIHDNDPTPGRADPDVYYAVWDGTSWGSAQPIESGSNDRFELDPVVAFMPNGDAIAVWSANTAPDYVKDLNSIFSTQDIYYSIWNHTTGEWGDVQQLISDSLPDGLASVAVGPRGQVLVAWNKILSDSISDKRSWAVYYTYWDGTHWTDPAPIPGTDTDNAADCMVRVAYSPDGTAIAVWLYDGDGDFATTFDTDLKYAIWDGQSWSSAEMLTSTAQEAEQNASVVFDSLGRAIVVWTAKDSTIDRLYFSMMDTTGDWSTPELIYETPQFAYQPIVQVTDQDIVMVFWRGYQGYDGDLFYTMKDLRNSSGWLQPRALTDDSLTDWLATMAIDANNNALYIWSKWNWTGSQPLMAEDGRYFADGLFFAGKGIKSDMSLGDLNMGAHPILPDLAVSNSSMSVSDRFAALGDTVTVSAVVWNSGDVASDTVTVRFTYGHPDSGDVLIEPEFRIALEPDSSETLTVQWVVQPGINRIYVVIDPENVEQELSEANNIAFVDCYVVADLAIDSTDISFDNPNPLVGDTVTVTAWVHNIGSVASDSVLVAFYDGNPDDSTSILLDSMRIGAVAPDDSVEVETRLAATYGEHRIFVAIDPENELLEPNESNNTAFGRLKVLPDLFVNELSFDTVGFDTVEVVAVIANDGGVSAGSFTVAFYDGDPMVGGELFDSVALDSMSAFSEDTVAVLWTPTPGQHEVFVVVDINDSVLERNEFNNRLSGSIFVQGHPDLAISDDGIATSDDHPHSGDTLTITAWVKNIGLANALAAYVRLYLVDGDTSFIDGVVLPVIEAGDSAEAQFDWIIPDDFTGTARLMVYADPNDSIPEPDETNNAAITRVFVNTPEITVSPEEFDVVVDSSVTVSETLIVRNTGSADLIFNIAVDYGERLHLAALLDGAKPDTGWLDVSISCDTVAENDSTMVEIAMNSEGLSYGYHLATLEIANNDSANPILEVPVRFGVRPPAPEPISPADSELVTDSMPTFVWSIADGFTGTFVLQIALDTAFTSNLIEISNTSDTAYTMEQPLGDTTYWWRVKAITSDGLEGDFSEPHMFVVDAHAPSAPTLESPIDGVWLSDTLITLRWSRTHIFGWRRPEGAVMGKGSSKTGKKKTLELIEVLKQHDDGAKPTPVHYVVEVLRDSLTVITDTVDTNFLTVTLVEGRYNWHVMAFDEAGNASDWSPTDSFGVDVTPPSVDSMTVWADTAWFFGPFEVEAWISDNLSGVGSAWLFWSVDGSPFDSTAMSLSNGVWSGEIPAFSDSANHTVSYFVKALDNAEPANVSTSDTVSFAVTSISEGERRIPSQFDVLGAMPNPTANGRVVLKLALPERTDVHVVVYDAAGRAVWKEKREVEAGYVSLPFELPSASGVYFVKVSTRFGRRTLKVLSTHR